MDGANQVMESLKPAATSKLGKDNYRCIQLGLGSSLQGDDHGRILITDRVFVLHKLPANASSHPSPSVFYKDTPHPLTVYHYITITQQSCT